MLQQVCWRDRILRFLRLSWCASGPTRGDCEALVQGYSRRVHQVLRGPRAHVRALQLAPAGRRPDAAVRQRRDEPVQGDLPGDRCAGLRPCRQHAEVHPRGRQAQRPGGRRARHLSPHVLRDAGQLELRRLLQGRNHRLGLGASDGRVVPAQGPPVRHGIRGRRGRGPGSRRRGPQALGRGHRHRPVAHHRRRQEGQFLGDGRDGPVRALQRDPRRSDRRRLGGRTGKRRRRPGDRDLEPGVHPVQPWRRRQADAAAGQARGHRHGPRTRRNGHTGQEKQLRHRPVRADYRGDRDAHRLPLRIVGRGRRPLRRDRSRHRRRRLPGGRRPRANADVRHSGRDNPLQRGAGIRGAADPAPGGEVRQAVPEHRRPVPGEARAGDRRADGRCVPGGGRAPAVRDGYDPRGGGIVRADAGPRNRAVPAPGGRAEADRPSRAAGRRGVRSLRDLRVPRGPDADHGGRARAQRRHRRLRRGDGPPPGAVGSRTELKSRDALGSAFGGRLGQVRSGGARGDGPGLGRGR